MDTPIGTYNDGWTDANFPYGKLSVEKESSAKLLRRYNMSDNIILTGMALLIL